MRQSLNIFFVLILTSFASCAQQSSTSQRKLVGTCEGCEAIFEYEKKKISSVDTLPDFELKGTKVKISGTVYKNDGESPAPNVVLYVYHTNQDGVYENRNNASNWEKRHGYIRGWVKTDSTGKFTFYTLKPGVYPDRSVPAHIHITVLEPDGKYYWIEDFYFRGDPLLSEKEKYPENPRGGHSGLINLVKTNDYLLAERDIILGENVPNYK